MAYDVSLSFRAERDACQIQDWLAKRSPAGASRWLDALDDAVRRLSEDPLRFPLAPESDVFPVEVHEIHFKTRRGRRYRALFSVEGVKVHVVAIRGPGQPPVRPEET